MGEPKAGAGRPSGWLEAQAHVTRRVAERGKQPQAWESTPRGLAGVWGAPARPRAAPGLLQAQQQACGERPGSGPWGARSGRTFGQLLLCRLGALLPLGFH